MKASGRPAAGTSHITLLHSESVCVCVCVCVYVSERARVDRDGRMNENE